jgi:hypothetical protein
VSKGRRLYDWPTISDFYSAGHPASECQRAFRISNGAWHAAVQRGTIILRRSGSAKPRGRTREAVAELFARGLSQTAIARQLDITKPTVCFHLRKLGVPPRTELAKRYDWEEIRAYYEAGNSANECRRRFGFSLNAWADAVRRGVIVTRPRMQPIEQVLAAGRRRCRQHVKARLLHAGLKHRRCEQCGLTHWRGRPLSLELHHVNGDGQDNRLENLRLLCPNCHSQTDTWGARNKGRLLAPA